MSYVDSIKRRDNATFGIMWGLVSFFIGVFLIKVIGTIETLIDYLLQALFFVILFPINVAKMVGADDNMVAALIIVMLVGIVFAPIVKKFLTWILNILRASPV